MPTTPVCTIDATGIHVPDYDTVRAYFVNAYRAIYGQDVYLGNDAQDGQFLSLLALAVHESNGATVAAYNAYSPATAQGTGLSSVVKINGVSRLTPTFSTVDLTLIGQASEIVVDGAARGADGTAWLLPSPVVFPASGQITVTATAATIGAINAAARTITTIATPTKGWQSVTNLTAATPGQPVESDAQLRRRQGLSTALTAVTPLEALQGAILAISGVAACKIYENDTNDVDANGVPGHAICPVVDGGNADDIAQVIKLKKPPGVGTYGDVSRTIADAYGIARSYQFFRPKATGVAWYVVLRPKAGYTTDVAAQIRASLAAYTNRLGIGTNQSLSGAYPAANLSGLPQAATFEIVGLRAARANSSSDAYGDVTCAFNERLVCNPEDVDIRMATA